MVADLRFVAGLEIGDLDAVGAALDPRIGDAAEQANGADARVPGVADQQRRGRRPFLAEVAVIAFGCEGDMEAAIVEGLAGVERTVEHTSELQSLMRSSSAVL